SGCLRWRPPTTTSPSCAQASSPPDCWSRPTERHLMSHPHPDLPTPPALPEHGMRVVALGGLGEIGRNMAVLEYQGRLLIIDCGVLFPEDHQPGVDLILPDFEYIAGRMADVEAII